MEDRKLWQECLRDKKQRSLVYGCPPYHLERVLVADKEGRPWEEPSSLPEVREWSWGSGETTAAAERERVLRRAPYVFR